MTMLSRWARPALIAAALAIPGSFGCNQDNDGKDPRTGRGLGDETPATGPGSEGTNASTSGVTAEGPGGTVVKPAPVAAPSVSTPAGGDGAGAAPPVTPVTGAAPSGDSNSGQKIGENQGPGADSGTGAAKASPNTPPR